MEGTYRLIRERIMGDILCPNCKSKDTEFDDLVTTPEGKMVAKSRCNACGHKWDSPFSL
jgi:hypothetical protein